MKCTLRILCLAAFVGLLCCPVLLAQTNLSKPLPRQYSPEARALLQFISDISGKYTLTGQHNYPNTGNRNSQFAAKYIGKTPVVFSSDMGHAKAGDSDSYLARPDIVREAIRQHNLGALVTLCWHAVPPTADEPVTFRKLPNSDPKALASVSGQLLDEQFKDVLTPGTPLHTHWCAQVDAIAVFLKQLQEAHVPVLWRPYHEMNGDWFWWGGRTDEFSTSALYRQIFDRLVNHHHLDNLIWVWSMDRVSKPGMEHARFFPGIDYVDILALDVYGNDFSQSYYDSLVSLSQGKPVVLGEVGNAPTPEILSRQPKWAYFVTWASMVRNTSKKQYETLIQDPRVLGLEDPAYANASLAYRKACGLPPVHLQTAPADFSGHWVLNEEKSNLGTRGAASAPARMEIDHRDLTLTIKTARIIEYAEDEITEEKLVLDGSESQSKFMNLPRVTSARRSESGEKILLESSVSVPWGKEGSKMLTTDTWQLLDGGKILSIQRCSSSPRGEQTMTLIFDKR